MPLGSPFNFTDTSGFFFTTPTYTLSFHPNRLKTRDEKTQPILWVFIQIFAKRKDLKPFSFSSCSQPPGLLRLHLHCKYLQFPCIRYQTGIIFNIKCIFVILFWMCCSWPIDPHRAIFSIYPKIESPVTISLSQCCIVLLWYFECRSLFVRIVCWMDCSCFNWSVNV